MLGKLKWNKRKGATGIDDPSPQFLAEGKFSFQRNISTLVTKHGIPPCLNISIDQTPMSFVNTGKYTFSFKVAKIVPVRGVEDKHQTTATFAVICTGDFLSIQLIYSGKTKRSLPKFSCPSISVTLTENHLSNTEISGILRRDKFSLLGKYQTWQRIHVRTAYFNSTVMDTFKGQDNDTLRELCGENNCDVVILPHNLTNKFQPVNLLVKKVAEWVIQNKYNDWFADQVSTQQSRTDPTDVKI